MLIILNFTPFFGIYAIHSFVKTKYSLTFMGRVKHFWLDTFIDHSL